MDKVDFEDNLRNKEYAERYAKLLLGEVYHCKYNYAIQADKPDIQYYGNKTEGIEVTSLSDINYNQLKRYKKTWAKNDMTLEEIVATLPTNLKGSLTVNKYGNIAFSKKSGKRHSIKKWKDEIIGSVTAKLNKLQEYKKFDENNLLIFAPTLTKDLNAEQIAEALNLIDQTKFSYVYDNILILTYNSLSVYPFKNKGKFKTYYINEKTREYCNSQTIIYMPHTEPKPKKKHMGDTPPEPGMVQ